MNSYFKHLFATGTMGLLLWFSAFAQIGNIGRLNTWTTREVARAHNSTSQASYVKTVRASEQNGFDRVVFEFEGPFPNYDLKYLKSPFYKGEAGRRRIRQPGKVFLMVEFFVVPTDDNQLKLHEVKDFTPKGRLRMPSVQSVKDEELFEGFYDFLVGVSARKPFRITELSNPSRLVIDFKH